MRLLLLASAAILVSCAAPSGPAESARAQAVVERIFATFNACQVEPLLANYSDGNVVFFTPGTPKPLTSRDELRDYFNYLESEPCSSSASAKHTSVALYARQLAHGVAIVHATTVVKYEENGTPISFPFYFTFVLQESGGQWLVVSQNAQPVPKP
jgi:ketosteroid isomerase-like protein